VVPAQVRAAAGQTQAAAARTGSLLSRPLNRLWLQIEPRLLPVVQTNLHRRLMEDQLVVYATKSAN